MDGLFVAYYRVSTRDQGASGLGLEAQRKSVATYLNGGSWKLIAEYQEVESGKRDDNRPHLQAALEQCRLTGAKLVIAKLDRLSRNSYFLNGLLEAGVDFICCDMPSANPFTLRLMAALAQQERELISARTKAGLSVIKEKLGKGESHISKAGKPVEALGGYRGHTPFHEDGGAATAAKADRFAATVAPMVKIMRDNGASLAKIAGALNEQHIKTARGSQWTAMAVKRVLDRVC